MCKLRVDGCPHAVKRAARVCHRLCDALRDVLHELRELSGKAALLLQDARSRLLPTLPHAVGKFWRGRSQLLCRRIGGVTDLAGGILAQGLGGLGFLRRSLGDARAGAGHALAGGLALLRSLHDLPLRPQRLLACDLRTAVGRLVRCLLDLLTALRKGPAGLREGACLPGGQSGLLCRAGSRGAR